MGASFVRDRRIDPQSDAVAAIDWRARFVGGVWAGALRLLCATWRKRYEGFTAIDGKRAEGARMMLCFWHGQYLPVFALCRWLWIERRNERACVFTSRSRRGQVISEICRHFGLDCVQIPDSGNKHSYRLMRDALADHTAGVIAVDGPLGPYRRVKQGAVRLAAELGYCLVPAAAAARWQWASTRRWDRMELPLFFTRVGLSMGQPVSVPSDIGKDGLRIVMDDLSERLEALERRAQLLIGAG